MANRSDLIRTINTFDTATLEKLAAFANTMLIPDADLLIRASMPEMLEKAHQIADSVFPEWTDRSQADFGEFLVELFALFSWKDFWYMNAFAQEAFLQRSQTYINVVLHALRLGYSPVYSKGSTATFALTFSNVPSTTTILPGQIEITYPESSLVFTNINSFTVSTGTTVVVNTSLQSGKYVATNLRFNGKSIRFPAQNIDPSSIRLYVEGVQWSVVQSFAQSNTTSKHFMVMPTDGGNLEVIFGISGYGERPPRDAAITIEYAIDPTLINNVPLSLLTVITKNVPNNYLSTAVMTSAATGGTKAENIESIRQNASLLFRSQNYLSITTSDDAVRMMEAMGDVRKATAFRFNILLIYTVIPEDGSVADSAFLTLIYNRLYKKVLMGFTFSGSITSYVTLTELSLTAYMYNEFNEVTFEQNIRDYIAFTTDPLEGAQYGVGFDPGELANRLIEVTAGMSNVVFTSVNGAAPYNIPFSALQIFSKINDANVHITIVKVSK